MDENKEVGKRKITRYLSPDWSVVSPTKRGNATHEVAIEEVTYADGRIVQYVLNGQGERESPIGVPTYDPEIQRAWQQQQAQANREQPAREGDTRGPQTGPKREVYREGKWVVEDNPVYQAPGSEAATPAQQRTAREEAEIAANAALPPDQDPRPETNAQRAERAERTVKEQEEKAERERKEREGQQRAPSVQTVQGGDGQTYTRVVTIVDGKPVVKQYGPNGQEVAQIPGERQAPSVRQVQGSDGQTYTIVTTMDQGGTPTVRTYDPSGKVVQAVPTKEDKPDKSEIREIDGELQEIIRDPSTGRVIETRPIQRPQAGASTGARLPQIIVGQSEQAIRAMDAQNAEEVAAGRMTPAQRANRLQEAFQFANIALNDAQQVQRRIESARATGFNIASTRLDYFGNGMQNALKFTMDLNTKLPAGSPAGYNAFVALLTMQMAIAQQSGIMDLEIPDEALTPEARARRAQQRASMPTPRLSDPTNPAKIEADRQAALADPAFRATETMDADGTPREFTSAAATGSGAAVTPPAAPVAAPPAVTPAVAPAVTPPVAPATPIPNAGAGLPSPAPAAPPAPPAGVQPAPAGVPTESITVRHKVTGAESKVHPSMLPTMTNLDEFEVVPPAVPPLPTEPSAFLTPPDELVNYRPGPEAIARVASPSAPGSIDSMRYGHGPGDDALSGPDFPVLPQMQPPAQSVAVGQSPAMLRSLAASLPPWRIDTPLIEQMLAAGIPEEEVFSIPRPRVMA